MDICVYEMGGNLCALLLAKRSFPFGVFLALASSLIDTGGWGALKNFPDEQLGTYQLTNLQSRPVLPSCKVIGMSICIYNFDDNS